MPTEIFCLGKKLTRTKTNERVIAVSSCFACSVEAVGRVGVVATRVAFGISADAGAFVSQGDADGANHGSRGIRDTARNVG